MKIEPLELRIAPANLAFGIGIGAAGTQSISDAATDTAGNTYVTGTFQGAVDFDPGPGVSLQTAAPGQVDAFIAKYTTLGELAWVNIVHSTDGMTQRPEVAVSGFGDVFITAQYGVNPGAAVRFQEGSSSDPEFILNPSSNKAAAYVTKIDATGHYVWTQNLGGANATVEASDIVVSPQGDIYFSGTISNGAQSGSVMVSTQTLTSDPGETDAIFVKIIDGATPSFAWATDTFSTGAAQLGETHLTFDAGGRLAIVGTFSGFFNVPGVGTNASASDGEDVWVGRITEAGAWNLLLNFRGGGDSIGHPGDHLGIQADGQGGLFLTGTFSGTMDMDPGAGVVNVDSDGGSDLFFVRLNSSGAVTQATQFGTENDEKFLSFTRTVGGYALAGVFETESTFFIGDGSATITSSGLDDVFLLRMNGTGTLNDDVRRLSSDDGSNGKGILLDEAAGGGFVLTGSTSAPLTIAGSYRGTYDADPGTGIKNLVSKGGVDAFIAAFLPENRDAQVLFQPALGQSFSIGGSGNQAGLSVEVDASGNYYIAGYFAGTVDFDPGASVRTLSAGSDADYFVAKYSADGKFAWVQQLGVPMEDNAPSIHLAVDSLGTVYVTGEFATGLDYEDGGLTNRDTEGGTLDVFIIAFDPTGGLQWLESVGSGGNDFVSAITVGTGTQPLVLAGTFTSTMDFDPSNAFVELTPVNNDAYLLGLEKTGDFRWVKQLVPSNGSGGVADLAMTSSGDAIVVGTFTNTLDMDFGGSPFVINATAGGQDAFVARYSGASGTPVYAEPIGGVYSDEGTSVEVMGGSPDMIYVGGVFRGALVIDAAAPLIEAGGGALGDGFVLKYDEFLNVADAVALGGVGADTVVDLGLDADGSLLVLGRLGGSVDFDPSSGFAKLVSTGATNLFVASYQVDELDFQSAYRIDAFDSSRGAGAGLDLSAGLGFAVDAGGNALITGGFFKTFDADIGAGTRLFTSKGGSDLVFAKYVPANLADATHTRFFRDALGNIVTVRLIGPGSVSYTLENGAGDFANIEIIELSGTTLASSLIVTVKPNPGNNGTTTIGRIVTTGVQQHMGSIALIGNITLGDDLPDTVPDLLITGAARSIVLGDLAENAFIKLGQDLPYNVPNNTTTPDTYNNKPNLTVNNVGQNVVIEVTGDGTPQGVGGGGLGKVVIGQWENTGFIYTTQSIGSLLVLRANFMGILKVDPGHLGEGTTAGVGSMTVQDGAWGSSGSEIEGNIGAFNAEAFLAGASITAGSIGKVTITNGSFEGTLTLTDPVAAGTNVFTVNSDFTGSVVSSAPLKSIKVKGNFMGSLKAPTIGAISAFSFTGTTVGSPDGDSLRHDITATDGPLGAIRSTAGSIVNYEFTAAGGFGGLTVRLVKLSANTFGLDNVSVEAASIGKTTVSLTADKIAAGLSLTGIRNSQFVTTGTAASGVLRGSIAPVNVTVIGTANGASGTGIVDSLFDARVDSGEFGPNPGSSSNSIVNVRVTVKGQGGAGVGMSNSDFLSDAIGPVTVLASKGTGIASTSHAVNDISLVADNAIGALMFDGDATSDQVRNLSVLAGQGIGSVTVKAKTLNFGNLSASTVLAGQSLNTGGLTEADVRAALAKANLGPVKLTGTLSESTLAAGASIGAVTIGGTLDASKLIAGARFGGDYLIDGDETWQATAAVAAVTVKGEVIRSSIVAGVNPVNGVFGDADDIAAAPAGILTQTSSIGALTFGTLDVTPAGSVLTNHGFAIQAALIKSLKTAAGIFTDFTVAQFLEAGTAGEDVDDITVRLIG